MPWEPWEPVAGPVVPGPAGRRSSPLGLCHLASPEPAGGQEGARKDLRPFGASNSTRLSTTSALSAGMLPPLPLTPAHRCTPAPFGVRHLPAPAAAHSCMRRAKLGCSYTWLDMACRKQCHWPQVEGILLHVVRLDEAETLNMDVFGDGPLSDTNRRSF